MRFNQSAIDKRRTGDATSAAIVVRYCLAKFCGGIPPCAGPSKMLLIRACLLYQVLLA